jgi:type IV pilus assembly protein PilA
MGLLMAVAVPTLLGQVGKAREAEVLSQLGAIARTQQARHFQKGRFASTMAQIEAESGVIAVKYYDLDNITTDPSQGLWVKIKAIPFNGPKDQVRNFAIGVYFNSGSFERATCRGEVVGVDVEVGNTASDPCTNNGTKLQ